MRKIQLFLLLATLSLITSCVTKSGKTTKLGKFYHNVTGRYNGYYNANMLLDESFEALSAAHQDNYNKLLHLYPYAAVLDPNSANANLDEAIKKCAINIELHRPSNWVDDSYFIVGRSEYLKQKYEKAAATFKFIVDKYNPDKSISAMSADELSAYKKATAKKKKKGKKKRRKKRRKRRRRKRKKKRSTIKTKKTEQPTEKEKPKKPKKYFLKHRPVRQEAMLWLAKSYIEQGLHDEAGTYLRIMQEDPTVRRKIKAEVFATTAYSWLQRKALEKAIEPLSEAIRLTRNRKQKTRYLYVLSQIYQQLEKDQLAMENFKKILRLGANYEMEFNARLNMATSAAGAEERKINPTIALSRMLKDPKNEEYKDQIYFALAQIQFKSGNRAKGILALQQTMANSPKGSFQRAEAAYMLAELYYEEEAYIEAYHYYDTTSTSLSKKDERTAYIEYQKDQLKDLAQHLELIITKDSLLTIASWNYEKQRTLVQQVRKEERDKKSSKNPARGGLKAGGVRINNNAVNQSKFSLYNSSMIKRGERNFKKRWGERNYQDNWRRSGENNFESKDNTFANAENDLPPVTEQEVVDYLKKMGVPKDDVGKKKINDEIAASLFKVGNLYYEQLAKKDKAKNSFKTLLQRYPETQHELETLFMLYNIAKEEKNEAAAQRYKNQILDKYEDSDIAKSLQDPNFLNDKEKELVQVNQYYEDTYRLIQKGMSKEAYNRIKALPTKYGDKYPMKARFALLAAMCQGGMKGIDEYIRALRTVATSFPNTEEERKAKEMIALLTGNKGGQRNKGSKTTPNQPKKGLFVDNMKEGHYIIVAFTEQKTKVNDYKVKIFDYNKKYFSLKRLNVSSFMLDTKYPALIIRKFKNGTEAKAYFNTVHKNKKFLGEKAPEHEIYFIGQTNYRQILQKRNFSAYQIFFAENYGEE